MIKNENKDTLTSEKIAFEYHLKHLKSTCAGLFALALSALAVGLSVYGLICYIGSLKLTLSFGLMIIMFGIISVVIAICIVGTIIIDRALKNGRYRIVTDKIVGYREKDEYSRRSITSTRTVYILNFASYGEFRIPAGENYPTSKNYCMTAEGVYNSTHPDDEFYLVMYKNTIIQAYNRSMFKLKDEIE